jgi:uncharacterized membrane protein
MSTEESRKENVAEEDTRAFIAPCRQLDTLASLRWIKQGFQDYRRAPTLSILYGAIMVAISWLISAWAWKIGSFTLVIVLFAGFVFLGPALAIGLYSVSCQLDKRLKPRIGFCLTQGKKRFGNQMIFALVLLIVFLVWARAATMVNIFLPMSPHPGFAELLQFLVIGGAIGSLFALVIFCAGVFSLPMMMDRDVDAITAMLTSFNAVLKNKPAMLVWEVIILASILIGFLTLFAAFLFTLPIIGYASWRGYKETIISDEWPQDPDTLS